MGTNRLAAASSAYLRSAAHQPVDWFPWGPEAFAAAAATDRPVLLDVGAVWCHWCHVMDAESYEDPALAELLNRHFVCVKVDRDERPDVDARYQRAVQALTRQGGWPLTGFLTPQAELFYGGTYFPPQALYGRPSFREILTRILELWSGERARLETQARALRGLLTEDRVGSLPGVLGPLTLADAAHRILATADRTHGGFGTQPKFPHPAALTVLLHHWCDTPEPTFRAVIRETLDGMANGGFRDLLGGGFHRYSVDARWIVPHFEKLSADNAELLRLYVEAGALFEHPGWLEVARETVRWIREVLADSAGGFAASQDADVGLEDDGDYFTWTLEELHAVLTPAEVELASAHFGIGTAGRMTHAPERNVLFTALPAAELALRRGQSLEVVRSTLAGVERKLRAARAGRTSPLVDRTRYAGWNALLAGALLRAGPVLDDPWCSTAALAALRRIRSEQSGPETVAHTAGGVAGLLEDPVHCAAAALDAFELTGEREWLEWSAALMERVWREHWDKAGGLRDLAGPHGEGLLSVPVVPIQDSPNASPNGVAGQTLARLFEHTLSQSWRERHEALLRAFGATAADLGVFAAALLLALDWLVHPATHLVITGPERDPLAAELHQAALAAFVPRRVVVRLTPGRGAEAAALPPALRGLVQTADLARGYICTGTRCLAPVDTLSAWQSALRSLLPADDASAS